MDLCNFGSELGNQIVVNEETGESTSVMLTQMSKNMITKML